MKRWNVFRHTVPFASLDYPFSNHWPALPGTPDHLMVILGDIGLWQIVVVILMMLFNIPTVFHVASPEVTGVNHKYWCKRIRHKFTYDQWEKLSFVKVENFVSLKAVVYRADRGEIVNNPCLIHDLPYMTLLYDELVLLNATSTLECLAWDFEEEKNSVLSQFSLACTTLPVNNMAESMFSLGAAVGGILNSYIADRFGRRKLLMGSLVANVLIGFYLASASSYTMYLALRIILGFTSSAVLLCSFVICIEITGGEWRDIMSTIFMYSYSLGYILLHLISGFFNNWIYLQYSITLIAIFLVSIWWRLLLLAWTSQISYSSNLPSVYPYCLPVNFDKKSLHRMVPESPRWLLAVQNLPKLMNVLETASDYNRRPLPPGTTTKMKGLPPMKAEFKSPSTGMLFSGDVVRRLSMVTPFVSFFSSITYFGLVLNNDLFPLGLLYSGIIEFAAVSFVLILRLKNDVVMVTIANGLSGLCCLAASSLVRRKTYQDVAVIAARFFGGMVNSSLTTILATMYPTLIRTLGLGWGNFFTNIALAVAANIFLLSTVSSYLPLIVLGISGLLGSFSLLFLPGRATRDLHDLPEEAEFAHKTFSQMRRDNPETKPILPKWFPTILSLTQD